MKKAILILFLLLIPLVFSLEGSMPLLAVKEQGGSLEGSIAELHLEIQKGTGRVFVDTFPLSKVDTQISMRFAKEIACDLLDYDCGHYDFIYTIRADSPIIGGPSAGAAATVLTMTVLSGEKFDEKISATGTINSGGLVGPVGGVKEKIEAGAAAGLHTILIPFGEREIDPETNLTINFTEFGKEKGVIIIEITDIYQALDTFTGKDYRRYNGAINVSSGYADTMKMLANQLCERTGDLRKTIVADTSVQTLYDDAYNLSLKGESAYRNEEYYSAASFCFGSNVKFSQAFMVMKNFSDFKYSLLFEELRNSIGRFDEYIDKKEIKTITDLESYMVVKERLAEAQEYLNVTSNDSYAYSYAYANERLRSAHSWAEFFTNSGKQLNLDNDSLKASCQQRIAEAEERLQFALLTIPFGLSGPRSELVKAYSDFDSGNYALCLFRASKSKAESDIVFTSIGIDAEDVPLLIDKKLEAANRVIVKGERQGTFPVLGYSYFEYAKNLKESDEFSSLLYAEYALELSNLDIYFKETAAVSDMVDFQSWQILAIGIVIGLIAGSMLMHGPQKTRRKR